MGMHASSVLVPAVRHRFVWVRAHGIASAGNQTSASPAPQGWKLGKEGDTMSALHPDIAETITHEESCNAVAIELHHFVFHDARHSAASAMVSNDVDLKVVAGVLGHKDSRSTGRYAHLQTSTLARAIAKIK